MRSSRCEKALWKGYVYAPHPLTIPTEPGCKLRASPLSQRHQIILTLVTMLAFPAEALGIQEKD